MLLSYGFNDEYSFPFTQLRKHVGIDKWKKRRWAFDPEKVGAFVAEKTAQLERYDAELAETEADKARVDRTEMTREEFIAKHHHALISATTPLDHRTIGR